MLSYNKEVAVCSHEIHETLGVDRHEVDNFSDITRPFGFTGDQQSLAVDLGHHTAPNMHTDTHANVQVVVEDDGLRTG